MKFLRCGSAGNEKPAVLDKNKKIRDISSYIQDFDPQNINFNILEKLKKINLESLPEISSNERIGSCISKPGKFVAIGLNYSDHAAETGAKIPTEPIVFMKATSSIIGPNDEVVIPKNSKKTDWEVELEAPNHIFGYCIVNDVSEREFQIEKLGQWVKGKSCDTFGPIGPYLVTKDEIPDVQNINLSLDVNNKRMQTGNTKKMIFNVNYILSYLSNFTNRRHYNYRNSVWCWDGHETTSVS